MQLPFTATQFVAVFTAYNAAIWPSQLVAYGLGVAAVALVFARRRFCGAVVAGHPGGLLGVHGRRLPAAELRADQPRRRVFAIVFVGAGRPADRGRRAGTPHLRFRRLGSFLRRARPRRLCRRSSTHCSGSRSATASRTGRSSASRRARSRSSPSGCCSSPIGRRATSVIMPVLWAAVGTTAAMTLGVREDISLALSAVVWIGLQLAGARRQVFTGDRQPPGRSRASAHRGPGLAAIAPVTLGAAIRWIGAIPADAPGVGDEGAM